MLNILWAMDGMDMNLNTNISKHLADLGQTLTTLTSEEGAAAETTGYRTGDDSSDLSNSDGEGVDVSDHWVYYITLQPTTSFVLPQILNAMFQRLLIWFQVQFDQQY